MLYYTLLDLELETLPFTSRSRSPASHASTGQIVRDEHHVEGAPQKKVRPSRREMELALELGLGRILELERDLEPFLELEWELGLQLLYYTLLLYYTML